MALPFQRPASAFLAKARFPVRYPAAAIEIAPTEVVAVRVRNDRSGRRLAGYGVSSHRSAVAPPVVASGRSVATGVPLGAKR